MSQQILGRVLSSKVIAVHEKRVFPEIILTQDDIDYLHTRACETLKKFHAETYMEEKKRLWVLFTTYLELWDANKDLVGKGDRYVR